MTIVYREDGVERVWDFIRSGQPVRVPFLALMEVHYRLLRDRPDLLDETMLMIGDWPTVTVESNQAWREVAAMVKAQGKLSVVDAWAAALALMEDAELVHKDPEFETVSDLKMLTLPYKPRRGRS
jgi:predicted nucleic acid-binding protein